MTLYFLMCNDIIQYPVFYLSFKRIHKKYSESRHNLTKADKVLLAFFDNLSPVITALEPKYRHYTNCPLKGINRKINRIQRAAYSLS